MALEHPDHNQYQQKQAKIATKMIYDPFLCNLWEIVELLLPLHMDQ
jgi:hypothetical protein